MSEPSSSISQPNLLSRTAQYTTQGINNAYNVSTQYVKDTAVDMKQRPVRTACKAAGAAVGITFSGPVCLLSLRVVGFKLAGVAANSLASGTKVLYMVVKQLQDLVRY